MRNSFASYKPCTATDKWVPKADQALMREKAQMILEREREMERLLRREMPRTV
jgi:hypothetical protein